eukprot:8312061-Heterocapsa_arctica.AAC.1
MSSRRSNSKPGITSSTRRCPCPGATTRRRPLPDPGGLGTSTAKRTWRASREQQITAESSREEDVSQRYQPGRRREPGLAT